MARLRVQREEHGAGRSMVREGADVPVTAECGLPARGDGAARAEPAARPFAARPGPREVEPLLGRDGAPPDPPRRGAKQDRELGNRAHVRGGGAVDRAVGNAVAQESGAEPHRAGPADTVELARGGERTIKI